MLFQPLNHLCPVGRGRLGPHAGGGSDAGPAGIDATAEEVACATGLVVRFGEAGLRPKAKDEPRAATMPVEAPVPRLHSRRGDTQLQSRARRVINFVPVVPGF